MGYELDALLIRRIDLPRWTAGRPDLAFYRLAADLALLPLSEDQRERLGPWEARAVDASKGSRVARLTADFFGGVGDHDCTLWIDGKEAGRGLNINEVLHGFGVVPVAPQDAFDTVGLGRFRKTSAWVAQAVVDAAPDLHALLRDPRSGVRELAVARLGDIRVAAALEDKDYGVRLTACMALAGLGVPGRAALEAALGKAGPDDLWGLLHALGRMGRVAAPSTPKILPQLEHADWRIRLEAARTLGLSGAKEAVEALKRAARDPEELVRKAVEEALTAIASSSPSGGAGGTPPASRS